MTDTEKLKKLEAKLILVESLVDGVALIVERQDIVIDSQKRTIEGLRMFIKGQTNNSLEMLAGRDI
ncbi:MAG: hypothetical protein COA84_13830 [Robiginitomaculum sp.]|nr:MAG: hypothetical protein COA84_13830 [Robiginitomaculum sp.]